LNDLSGTDFKYLFSYILVPFTFAARQPPLLPAPTGRWAISCSFSLSLSFSFSSTSLSLLSLSFSFTSKLYFWIIVERSFWNRLQISFFQHVSSFYLCSTSAAAAPSSNWEVGSLFLFLYLSLSLFLLHLSLCSLSFSFTSK
jgi:hypothetical protein